MRVFEAVNPAKIKQLMQEIKVDPYGIKIMLPKATSFIVRVNSISNIEANILKQEMLSIGGDAAIARDALTGRTKKTDCLLMASIAQFNRLREKLYVQPFGLDKIAKDLSQVLCNYQRDSFFINLGRYRLDLSRRPNIMGIVNLTPDSFSQDGLLPAKLDEVIDYAAKLVADGADILDLGGESSRPGAKAISVKEELARILPVIKALVKRIKVPISIDTYKPEVAKPALDSGAVMINDITGLRNPKMAKIVARYKSGVVIMHMRGNPRNMQKNPVYKALIDDIIVYLDKAVNAAISFGVDRNKIIIDPGIGFGKTVKHNLEILNNLKAFKVLGRPLLVGTSRKSFIGKILNVGPQERIFGTVSSCLLAVENGARILRVHDVRAVRQALNILGAIEKA